jgi:hypothetical protein
MFNAIVEDEEEKSDVEIDEGKSKELKDKLAQSIEDFSSELKDKLTQSLQGISSEPIPVVVKEKKPIWSFILFGITFSVSLVFSMIMSVFVYLNAILGALPGGLLGESSFGDKFYYYVFFEKILGTYPESASFIRPTWEYAGSVTLQDLLLLGISMAFLFMTFVKLELRGFKLFTQGVAVKNASEGTEDIFKSSKVLVFLILIMYILTIGGALLIDNRIIEEKTLVLAPGDTPHMVQLGDVHTISWKTQVTDIGANTTYSVLVLDEFNCEQLEKGNSYAAEPLFSEENLDAGSAINPKRFTRSSYCFALIPDAGSESDITLKYTVKAE